VAPFIDSGKVLCVASYARNTAPVLTAQGQKGTPRLTAPGLSPRNPLKGA